MIHFELTFVKVVGSVSRLIFFKISIYLFLQRRERWEKGRKTSMCEKNINWLLLTCPQLGIWPTTQTCALTGNWTSDLWVCRLALSPLSHTRQGKINFPLHVDVQLFQHYLLKRLSLLRVLPLSFVKGQLIAFRWIYFWELYSVALIYLSIFFTNTPLSWVL